MQQATEGSAKEAPLLAAAKEAKAPAAGHLAHGGGWSKESFRSAAITLAVRAAVFAWLQLAV